MPSGRRQQAPPPAAAAFTFMPTSIWRRTGVRYPQHDCTQWAGQADRVGLACPHPIASAREIARSTMAVASVNEMFISTLSALDVLRLDPDVFLSDGAVAPPRHRHHLATVLEFADHAGPLS